MRNIVYLFFLITLFQTNNSIIAQDLKIEGYAFESDDRGYLNLVQIDFIEPETDRIFETVFSNPEGFFSTTLPSGKSFKLRAKKELFFEHVQSISTLTDDPAIYVKVKMEREPGYILDVTMAQKKDSLDVEVDAIIGARIDIYNNTQEREELVWEDYLHPNFQYTLKKGNHYTLLIRQKEFLAKRIEAYVNVNGCIVCIDGVGSLTPGVSDNLTQGFEMGTLLANVELDRINFDKVYRLNNIYYDLNKATLKPTAKTELDNLITVLKDNPEISIELGSHTDSRGRDRYNLRLSQKRAESASQYLISQGDIDPRRIIAKGYGETQLVNSCSNDVDCPEDEHQKNRRTEFKILDVSSASDFISLSEIKRVEKMESMIKEIQNQEIVEFRPGDEMPEDLKKQLEKERSNKKKNNHKRNPLAVNSKSEIQESKLNSESETNSAEKPGETMDEASKVLPSKIRNVSDELFSGYLVKIYVSTEKLNTDSPQLERLTDIWEQKVTDKLFYYFLGTFEQKEQAEELYEQLEGNCAVCSVVRFENGFIKQ